ncbi:AAA family ATPase [Leptolyngbya sp. AN02str]|uniref:AAA family ATPase n=1 Tax=Leptolyngbya sp. AN02str TaxID=3423363 RepID=UPI003D31CD80
MTQAAIPELVVMIGLPGSGKSTLAQQLAGATGWPIVSTDAIRAQKFGDEAIQGAWPVIWREVQRQLAEAVQTHQSVIYDATNVVRRERRRILRRGRELGFVTVTGLWLDVPLQVCLQRNGDRPRQVPEAVIARMHRRLVGAPPNVLDGCDRLIRCVDSREPWPLAFFQPQNPATPSLR